MDTEFNNFGNYEASAAPVQSMDINAFAKEADPEADYVKEFVRRERERERLGQAEAIRGVFENAGADAFGNIRADWNRVRDADALIARDRYFDDEPDTAARKYELERQTGIPSYLMSDPEVMGEAERRVWSENTRELLRGAPQTVTDWLNEPRNWAVAKDDAAVLAEVGRAWEALGKILRPKTALVAPEPDANLPAGIRQGLKDAYFNENYTQIMNEKYGPDAVWGLLPSFLQSISNYANIKVQRAEMDKFAYESGKFSSRLPAGIAMALNKDEMAASAQRSADFWAGIRDYTEQKNLVSRGIGDDVVQNMFYTLSGMPMSIALTLGGTMIAGPIGTVVGAGFSSLLATDAESHGEQAAAYHEMVAAGMDKGEAYDKSYREVYIPNFALLYLSNFAEDILTFGGGAGQSRKIARGLMKAGVSGSYARKIARFMGRGMKFRNALAVGFGGISEGVEEIGQGVIQNLALGRENDWAQLGYEGVVGILNGVMFGGIGSGLRAGIEKLKTYRNDMNASRAANAYNAQVERIQQISAASAVLQRSPETFADFQASAANNAPAFIDAAVFNQVLGDNAEISAEQLGISAEEVQSAAAVGGYIEFDAGKMTPEIWGALKDDIRSSEDGMSVNEARAFEAEQGKTIAELRQSVETELRTLGEFGAMARSVHEGIRKQILALNHAKFGAREAEANAAIYTAMLSQIAQKTGMTIEQVADMAKLRFTTGADGNVNVSGSRAVFGGSFDDIGSAMEYVPTWSERQGDIDPESANGGLNGLYNRRAFLLTAGEKLSAISKRKAYRDGTYSEFVRSETAALKADAESELAELRGIHGDAALSSEQMNRARAFNARMDALVEAYGGEAYAIMDKGPFEAVFRQILGEKGAAALDAEDKQRLAGEEFTSRVDNLSIAREMDAAGADAKNILLATGWERGADGKWRYKVSSADFSFNEELFYSLPNNEAVPLPELWNAAALYEAYPQLRDIKVKFEQSFEAEGNYDSRDNTITLGFAHRKLDAAELRNIIIHEIQHVIQRIEDFARGGNPEYISSRYGKTVKIGNKKLKAYDVYHRLAGETEARSASAMDGLSDEELRGLLLSEIEDVARADQIALREMQVMASVGDGLLSNLTKWKNNIKSLISAISTGEGRKKASSSEVDVGYVSAALSSRIKQDTGIDIEAGFTHVLDGGHLFHILNRHGVGNENRNHQIDVTESDIDMLPDVLANPDKIYDAFMTREGLKAVAFSKMLDGNIVVIEAIRNKKKKLTISSVSKIKAGYDIEFNEENGMVVRKAKAGSSWLTSETLPQNSRRQSASDSADNISQNGASVNNETVFEQRAYHGTRHLIENLKFSLDKIGSGDGGQVHGWGIYLAEDSDVSRGYMRSGMRPKRQSTDSKEAIRRRRESFRITAPDGAVFGFKSAGSIDSGRISSAGGTDIVSDSNSPLLFGIASYFKDLGINDFDKASFVQYLKETALKGYDAELAESVMRAASDEERKALFAQEAERLYPENSFVGRSRRRAFIGMAPSVYTAENIEALKTIEASEITADMSAEPEDAASSGHEASEGNLYSFEIPENDELLDSGSAVGRHSLKVRKALKKLCADIGIKYDTKMSGQEFYNYLSDELERIEPDGESGDKKSSLKLAEYGVPGLRYFYDENGGSYNFVIWDVDRITDGVGVEGDVVKMSQNPTQELFNQLVYKTSLDTAPIRQGEMNRDIDITRRVPVIDIDPVKNKTITGEDRTNMSKLFGDGIVNQDTGFKLTLSANKKGAGHISHSAFNAESDEMTHALISSFFNLPEIVEKAVRVKYGADRKSKADTGRSGTVKNVHRFLLPIRHDGHIYILKLTAKEYYTGNAEIDLNDSESIKLYDQSIGKELLNNNGDGVTPQAAFGSEPPKTVRHLSLPTVSELSIGEMAVDVKDNLDKDAAGGGAYLTREEYLERTGEKYRFQQGSKTVFSQVLGEIGAERLDSAERADAAGAEFVSRISNLDAAKKMEAEGRDAKSILLATGWQRKADGWKYEIDDRGFGFKAEAMTALEHNEIARLGDVWDAPDVYAAYPEIADISFAAVSDTLMGGIRGFFDADKNLIQLAVPFDYMKSLESPDSDKTFWNAIKDDPRYRSTVLHEVQHAIQRAEGLTPDMNAAYSERASELEARNVQAREELTPEQRRGLTLGSTEGQGKSRVADMASALERAASDPDIPVSEIKKLEALAEAAEVRAPVYTRRASPSNSVTVRGESRFRKDSAGKHVETLVAVMKDGDRSTLVHEAAHVWLQMMIGMTGDADITFNDAAVEDWQKLTKWLGIDDIDFTNGLSEENEARYRNAHEKFASAFEKYLREGRAPNTALKRVFADFKRWLCAIYRAAKDIMYTDTEGRQVPFEISDDIRAVMDRILASEEEIELAASMRESFTDKVKEGAKEKLLVKLMGELSEQKRKEKAKLRDELRPGMRDEVSERREYRTLAAFTELPIGEGGMRLTSEGVNEDLKFALPGVIDDKNGYHIDFAAELLGYQSADELTADLLTASQNPIDEVVEGMLEDAVETSIIDDASALRSAAEEALHGKEALDELAAFAAELEANGLDGDNAQYVIPPLSDNERVRTQSGLTFAEVLEAESVDRNELFADADGKTALTRIDNSELTPDARSAGAFIADGDVRLDAGHARHIRNSHGAEIMKTEYFSDIETFIVDVLRNWTKIYEGEGNSYLLARDLGNKHHSIAAIEIIPNGDGSYGVNTGWIIRNRGLKNKKPLFTRRASPATALGSGVTSQASYANAEVRQPSTSRSSGVRHQNSLNTTLPQNGGRVNAAKLTREQVRAWRSAAEDAAIEAAAGMNIGKLTPGRYMLAERRHAEAALRAALRGDAETAFEHKRAELFSHAMAAEAMRVREDYEKGMRLLNKYWPNRGRLRGAIGGNAFAQIMGVLEMFNINGSDPMSANRPTLNEWIADKQAESNDVNVGSGVAQWIRDAEVRGQRFRVRDLTVSEFEDLITSVKSIDRLGRNEREIIIDGRTKRFDDAVGDMMQQYAGDFGEVELRDIDPNEDKSFFGSVRDRLGGFLGTLDRNETLLRIMDKGRDFGKWWSHFYKPIQDASNREVVMKRDSDAAVEGMLRKHFGSDKQIRAVLNRRFDTGLINPKDGKAVYWTGENLVGAMLNWGNAKGRERLVFGMGFAENANAAMGGALDLSVNMDEGGYQELLSVGGGMIEDLFAREATPQMWAFCQDVWDHIDTYWAETAALEERVNGYAPMKVQALPFVTADGTEMRGGYYPIRFNAAKDAKTAEHQSADTMKALYEDQVHKPNTRHGHTKERVERVIGRQLNLSLGVINEHLENVIHDITHREAIRDVNRLIDSEPLKRAMYRVIGRHGQNQFRPWVQFLANPTYMADGAERLIGALMGRAMANGLGLNIPSSMSQLAAIIPACWRLGINAAPAVANALTFRGLWNAEWVDEMCRKSPELADRFRFGPEMTLREINRITESNAGVRIKNKLSASLYCFISWMDKVVAAPVWQAAYDKALNQGMSESEAVNYADMILRQTNNPSARKERTQIMRGGTFRKMFTMYYSMYSSMYSLFREEQARLGRRGLPGVARMAAFSFMVFVLQSSLTEALKMRGPEGSGDDDELTGGDIAKWGAKNGVMGFAGMFPFFRDVVSGVGSAVGYRMSPVSDVGDSFGKFLNQSSKALNALYDGGDWNGEQLAREAVRMFGYASGLPGPQLWKWHRALSKWAEENWSPEKSFEFLRDAIYGVKEKKR